MPVQRLRCDRLQADALNPRWRPGEIAVDDFAIEADGLEDLRAPIALHASRCPSWRRSLISPLMTALTNVMDRLSTLTLFRYVVFDHVAQRRVGQVRIDRARPIADQQREMHALRAARRIRCTRLPAVRRAFAHQMMMHGAGGQQGTESAPARRPPRGRTGSRSCEPSAIALEALVAQLAPARRCNPSGAVARIEQHGQRDAAQSAASPAV